MNLTFKYEKPEVKQLTLISLVEANAGDSSPCIISTTDDDDSKCLFENSANDPF